jgi:hypothetical protein
MDASEKILNDHIKQAAQQESPNSFSITAGEGILVNGGGNNWGISSDVSQLLKNLKTATIQVCVNGNPMNLDVYVSKGPY